MQAQHLPHHPHGPPIPLTPHPAGLQPPLSVAGGSSFLSAFPTGFPGIPPHLASLKEEKGKKFGLCSLLLGTLSFHKFVKFTLKLLSEVSLACCI